MSERASERGPKEGVYCTLGSLLLEIGETQKAGRSESLVCHVHHITRYVAIGSQRML